MAVSFQCFTKFTKKKKKKECEIVQPHTQKKKESCPIPQFKGINSSVLRFLYSPTLTFVHDHRKNHSVD